ncbi:MAG: hypothetical protein ACF8QF_00800 [Phycisphaerales bacterium]
MTLLRDNWVGTLFDAELNLDSCDRYNNAELTIFLRVHLRQRNPAGGAATGTANDYGRATGTPRRIVRWDDSAWRRWTANYQRTGERFWTGKFWLMTPRNYADLDYEDRGLTYRPNIWCRMRLSVLDSPANAHTTIDVVRLDPRETFFGSHARLYDSRDLSPTNKGASMRQRAHVHEIGHLLGLGHSAQHRQACQSTGDTNSPICYGTNAHETDEVMGGGMNLEQWNAEPWMKAMQGITGQPQHSWAPMMRRHYPRSSEDVAANRFPTARPNRG